MQLRVILMKNRNITYHMFEADTDGYQTLKIEKGAAKFHQFGTNFELINGKMAQYTTAIIELPDGTVDCVPAENIRFIDSVTSML